MVQMWYSIFIQTWFPAFFALNFRFLLCCFVCFGKFNKQYTARWSDPRSTSSVAKLCSKENDMEHRMKSIRRRTPMQLQNVQVALFGSWWPSSFVICKSKCFAKSAKQSPRIPTFNCVLKSPPRTIVRPCLRASSNTHAS